MGLKPKQNLQEFSPQIASEWSSRNFPLHPSQVSVFASRKVWWLGSCGHEWEAKISARASGHGCPVCKGQKVLEGFNDLATLRPDLIPYWSSKNALALSEVTVNSGIALMWTCPAEHHWEQSPQKMASKKSASLCPYCSNVKVMKGFNDLLTTHPNVAGEWHPNKNLLLPADVIHITTRKVWWLCDKGHSWEDTVSRRVLKKTKCVYCINRRVLPGFNDLDTVNQKLAAEWHQSRNAKTSKEVSYGSKFQAWWLCEKGHEWQTPVHVRASGNLAQCPSCQSKVFVSKAEKVLSSYIESLGFEIKTNDRSVLPHQEIDIYIPSLKIGIEYNGVYWHSEAFQPDKARSRHESKWLEAKKRGVQLIQIWEDDWSRNPDLIKTMLAHKLGVSQQQKIFGRKTSVVNISTIEAKIFVEDNHIQGFASGSYYVGLEDKEHALVAVMILKKEPEDVYNIIRYATSSVVVGGFTKLLNHVETFYKPSCLTTFADHSISDGSLYENNGFVAVKQLKPDYSYVFQGERKHKFGYRLKRFKNDAALTWIDGLTEYELAKLNGLYRIWDAGKTKYSKVVSKKT